MYFKYKAIKNGQTIEREIEAATASSAIDYLKKNGYFPIRIEESKKQEANIFSSFFDKINFNDVVDFTRQIAIMLNAGLTLIDSLEILKKQIVKSTMRKMIGDIDQQIKSGEPFSTALKKYPASFPNLYISLVKSGEASGKLGEILLRLADNLEKERELKSRLKTSTRLFNGIIRKLINEDALDEAGPLVLIPGHQIRFSPHQERAVQALLAQFAASPYAPPSVKEAQAGVGEEVYTALLDSGVLVAVSPEVVFRKEDYDRMLEEVCSLFESHETLTAAQVRDHFNTSRRYVLAFLEHLDSAGITVRSGDVRRLKGNR